MKKSTINIVCIVFAIIMLIGTCANVYASANNNNLIMVEHLIEEMEQRNTSYYSQIENIMLELSDVENSQGMIDAVESYDINGAYRVAMTESLLLTFLNEGNELKEAANGVIQWKVPIITTEGKQGLVVLLEEDGKLSYIGMSVGDNTETWQINNASIRDAVNNATEFDGEIDSIQILHSYLYNTSFVYLDGEKSDYVILYSAYSKETGLENEKVYPVSVVLEQFNKCFDENILIEHPDSNLGVPFRTSSHSIEKMIFGFAVFAVSGFVVLLFLYKRKKAKE